MLNFFVAFFILPMIGNAQSTADGNRGQTSTVAAVRAGICLYSFKYLKRVIRCVEQGVSCRGLLHVEQ